MTAFVFPGQGAHRAGMAAAWGDHPAAVTFDEVGRMAGMDLRRLADDPAACAATAVAQPAVFAASITAWRAVTDLGVEPTVAAGHSLGEVAAAVAVGALSVADGARVVIERGAAFADACAATPGGMVAVLGADPAAVRAILIAVPDAVVANHNAPGQTVISAPAAMIDSVADTARAVGARVRRLDVEGAYHSPAMSPAVPRLARVLEACTVHTPVAPLVRGTDASLSTTSAAVVTGLVEGVLSPVRWDEVQTRLRQLDEESWLEFGAGGVLRGLAKRTVPGVVVHVVSDPSTANLATSSAARTTEEVSA